MDEVKATPEQQAVIENRGGTLLVSAAAGSGKTWVLVQRLMQYICGQDSAPKQTDVPAACNLPASCADAIPEDPPADISDFLIITYTKAAAKELRAKISKELSSRLAADPGNRHLQRQMSLIYMAQISTVHSFCGSILREYAHRLGLPPDFRIVDEEDCRPLQARAMEDTLEAAYEQIDTLPGMEELLDLLGGNRNDTKLEEAVTSVYKAVQSHPWPEKWIAECRADLDLETCNDAGETKWGKYLLQQVQTTAATWLQRITQDMAIMQADEKLVKNYEPAFRAMAEQLEFLQGCRQWSGVADLVQKNTAAGNAKDKSEAAFYFGKAGSGRKYADPDLKERIADERKKCRKAMNRGLKPFFASSDIVLQELRQSSGALCALLVLVERYTETYSAAKQRRRYMDYNDLEHEAIKLLVTESGAPSAEAREISSRYREIMVDEFQDSNAVQETIFAAVSRKDRNRFLVGDVKQSIYKFRLADPGIFLQKYRSYKPAEEAEYGTDRKLLLTRNFRSDPQILDAVNFVFRNVMSETVGDLQYGDAESLYAPDGLQTRLQEPAVELHVIDMDLENTEEARAPKKEEIEAAFVAGRIQEMVTGGTQIYDGKELRSMRYGDAVILLRSPASSGSPYIKALESAGIPVYCEQGGNVFDTQEASALISLLQIIDNPRRDIPLICVLQSPIGGFTSDELAAIRLQKYDGDYWEALQLYAAGSAKAQHFLTMLQSLRDFAPTDTVTRLLDQIWQKTDITAIYGAMEGGAQRIRNLEALYQQSLNFDGTLMDFLNRLEAVRKKKLAPPPPASADNCVTIMTIHKSKGLEFPVVFLADLFHKFNLQDSSQPVLVHPAYGLGAYVLDREKLLRYPSIARDTIQAVQRQETVSEEMRVLYVAMTRAQSRLIMSMCSSRTPARIKKYAADTALPVPELLAADVDSPGDWILMTALCRTEAGELRKDLSCSVESVPQDFPWHIRLHSASKIQKPATVSGAEISASASAVQLPDSAELLSDMQFLYPHQADMQIPSKLTATQLKGRSLDQETAEGAENRQTVETHLTRPRFRYGPVPLTAAEKGTATHLVMQFADFSRCSTVEGVQAELNRLVEDAFITQQQKEAVHPEQIAAFFNSAVGQDLLQAEETVREFKFSLLVPAADYYTGGEGEILLQGVVDCCILEKDSLTILDFKTDHVTSDTINARAACYRGQMDAYSTALAKIFERDVKKRVLYFFHVGRAVCI